MVMTRTKAAWLGCATMIASIAACHSIAGVEDKQLDPALQPGEAGTDAGPEADTETGPDAQDAPSDVTAEVSDAGQEDAFARPPLRPEGDASASDAGRTLTLAVRRYFIGTVDPETDDNDIGAWRRLGFDYDGECTTKQQSEDDLSDTCKLPSGADPSALEDGEKCRDNLGGNLLSQALSVLDPSFEKKAHNGTWNCTKATMILQIDDLDDGPDDPYAPGRLYVTAPRDPSQPMLWDGNDVLLVDSDAVLNGSVGEPKYTAPRGFVRNHVWMNDDFRGPPVVMPMMVLSQVAPVPTETATIAIRLEEDHVEARGAMFSAVIDTLTLEPFLRAGMLEATGCSDALTSMAMARFLPNRDLANSDTFVMPGEECAFLSFGGWLELKRVQAPQHVVDVPPNPSACDGGT